MEEAFLAVLRAEKVEMDLYVHLSPHSEYSARFVFMVELWWESDCTGYCYTLRGNSGKVALVWKAIDDFS